MPTPSQKVRVQLQFLRPSLLRAIKVKLRVAATRWPGKVSFFAASGFCSAAKFLKALAPGAKQKKSELVERVGLPTPSQKVRVQLQFLRPSLLGVIKVKRRVAATRWPGKVSSFSAQVLCSASQLLKPGFCLQDEQKSWLVEFCPVVFS